MLPTYDQLMSEPYPTDPDHLHIDSGMTTPCSPSETTASSETTSSSSIDDLQISYTIGVTEGTPYPCTFCDKAFPRLSYLKRHEQIHSDQMPFRCDYCQRLFKHKRSRDRHVKLHTGDKRYRCCHCESAFSRSDHLKIHMKTHDQMKPFQCAVCNRGYNTAAALTSHMQNHKRNNSINAVAVNNNNSNHNSNNGSNGSVNNSDNKNITISTTNSLSHESRGQTTSANKVSSEVQNRKSLSPSNSDSHSEPTQTPMICGFCGIKSTSLETHIRQTHIQHILFAGLLQNSFCQSAGLPNWQSLMPPPPPIPALTPVSDLMQLHSSLPNGSTSPPSPKKAKVNKSGLIVAPTTPTSSQPTPLPLLCNQCSPSPAFHDFESFRIHLKSHLIAAQQQQQQLHSHSLAVHSAQCPHCGQTITSDFETHLLNCHMGTVTTNYGCECCTKMFTKPDELQKHLMDIHAHHLYQCSLCRDMFDSKVSIQVHFAVKHSNECKIFKCNICGEFWNNEHDFKLHVKIVHFQPSPHLSPAQPQMAATFPLFGSKAYYRCKYCSEEFNIEYLLERHIEIEHSHQQKLTKTNCLNSEKSQNIYQISGKLQKRAFDAIKCEFCSTNSFKSIPELESHIKSEHKCNNTLNSINKSNNKCNICDEMFSSISQLAEHKLKKHCIFGASLCSQCLQCHAKINSKDDYMKHFVEHNNINKSNDSLNALFPVPCVICKQTLMSELEIDLHASYHCDKLSNNTNHSPNSIHSSARDAISPVVSESKLNSIKIESEIANQSPDKSREVSPKLENIIIESANDMTVPKKKYQCFKCQEYFRSESEITDHVHKHMQNEGAIECKLCSKEFDSPAKLQSHLIEHNFNGGNEYKCHLCKTAFNGSQPLRTHMLDNHLNERPFSCGQCSQKFWFPTELDNHSMAEHQDSDDVDIDCDDNCSEVSNSDVNNSEDRFKCRDCGKRFPLESHLKRHLKSSHDHLKTNLDNQSQSHSNNEKRFSCNICGKKFARKEMRKLHYKSHH